MSNNGNNVKWNMVARVDIDIITPFYKIHTDTEKCLFSNMATNLIVLH